jgi:predicted RNase H-like HicB family nuclease
MLTAYIEAAMRHARCDMLHEDQSYYCEIPELPGVWNNAPSLDSAYQELRDVLEGWIALGLAMHEPIPVLDGIETTVRVPS